MSSGNVESFGTSQVLGLGSCFDWTLEKIPCKIFSGNGIGSSSPSLTDTNGNEWQLRLLCLCGGCANNTNPHQLELILRKLGGGKELKVEALVNLSVCPYTDCRGDCYQQFGITSAKSVNVAIGKSFTQTCSLIGGKSDVLVHCRIVVMREGGMRKVPLETFCKDLLEETSFSDVTITTQENSFKAHKAVLSVRSPVLKTMFLSDFLESKENVLDLSTFSEQVVKGFLEFIYTGKTEILMDYASEWLRISDMYQMDDLKEYVEYQVGQAITINNAVIIFHTAYTYNAQLLKRTVTEFMKKNGKSVADNKGPIVELAKVNPERIADLFQAINS